MFLAVRLYCSFVMEGDIHTVLDLATLISTLWVIYMIRFKLKSTYIKELDNFPIYYYVVDTFFIVCLWLCFISVEHMEYYISMQLCHVKCDCSAAGSAPHASSLLYKSMNQCICQKNVSKIQILHETNLATQYICDCPQNICYTISFDQEFDKLFVICYSCDQVSSLSIAITVNPRGHIFKSFILFIFVTST